MGTRLRAATAGGLIAASLTLLFAGGALACSCAGPQPGEERDFYRKSLQRADGAIVGELLRKRPVGQDEYPRKAIYVYRVTRAFKAEERLADRKVRVRSAYDGAACGIEQRIGTRGGLLLDRDNGHWTSYLCSQISPRDLRRAANGDGGGERRASGSPLCAAGSGVT